MSATQGAALAVALGLCVTAGASHAGEVPCGPVEQGVIQIDGLTGDWKGARGVVVDSAEHILRGRNEWSGADDLSFEVFCNYDAKNLYLAVNVKDEYFIRTRNSRGDDHLVLYLGGRQLNVYPGDLQDHKGRMRWGRRGKVRGIEMVEALQRQGFSVELRIPFARLPRFRKGTPSYRAAVQLADCDSKARGVTQTVMGTGSARTGRFTFAQAAANLRLLLEDRGYRASQIKTRLDVDVVGDDRVEQVLLVGRTIGIVGEGLPGGSYFYLDLPIKRAADVYWLRALDLNGDRKHELVTRYVERSGNGRRELIAVYRFNDSNRFVRSFAHEILKGQKKRMIVNSYAFKRRRPRRRKPGGVDLVFHRPRAVGYTRGSYREAPASDVYPILLPWGEVKKRRFRFEGEQFMEL